MKYSRTQIPDIIVCEPRVFGDHRGYFMEAFKQASLNDFLGHSISFCQDNEASSKKGVLRGLHYQIGEYAQTKLVRVVHGNVLDIAVDIRKGSPTFGQHIAVELSAENKKQLLIPKGFAHGYITLSDTAIFSYKIDAPYSFEHERGIAYNDAKLAIDWQLPSNEFILSDKDTQNPHFDQATLFDYDLNYYE
ncbi:dTDP-4-dehydrorhamnose 3,5-epimerase [Ochrovirga pacifica]|uniref:dTDP-4-dehydrorhamnose 3,5-epimerase n=1 Tax=Ochrovirga pacifica TaxID=1042376 RepID=UPI0002557BDF|nr:dTDP-4-dehydrorhamnose 3,5-epimerase [Ochrovirga pacifica]